jgi:hypothetical protein
MTKKRKANPEIIQLKAKDIPEVRAKLLAEQGGKCLVCGTAPKRPCLDHSHTKRVKGTGLVRGVLCSSCNVFIAKSENNCTRYGFNQKDLPTILRSMADYFERDHHAMLHPSEAPKPKKLKKQSYNKLIREMKLNDYSKKIPEYPKSGKLTVSLEKLFIQFDMEPEFYK